MIHYDLPTTAAEMRAAVGGLDDEALLLYRSGFKALELAGAIETGTAVSLIHIIEDELDERQMAQRRERDDVDGGRSQKQDNRPEEHLS